MFSFLSLHSSNPLVINHAANGVRNTAVTPSHRYWPPSNRAAG
jgi:hypothetical protein